MTIKNGNLGGSDWTNGEVLFAEDLNDTFDATYDGLVPIGGVIPWFKDLNQVPSIPDSFVECNGQTVNDPESPLDGVSVPDLNGSSDSDSRFLRGHVSSEGTGGSATHGHGTDLQFGEAQEDGAADPNVVDVDINNSGNIPP